MIVDSALYRQGTRVPVDCSPQDLAGLRARATGERDFVWVGLLEPDVEELARVAEVFGLHPLAVEDAVKAHQRPKLEHYDDSLFLILKSLWYVDEDDAVETGEIHIFVGSDFIVTVRHGKGSELKSARTYLESAESVLTHGPSAVVYAVCDRVVDGYLAVIEELQQDVDEVEESVFSPARTDDAVRIYTLKREIAEVRRAVLPLREPMRRFATGAVVRDRAGGRRRSSATWPTTWRGPRTRSTRWTGCCPRRSTPTWPGSRCSRTTTCARSLPASDSSSPPR